MTPKWLCNLTTVRFQGDSLACFSRMIFHRTAFLALVPFSRRKRKVVKMQRKGSTQDASKGRKRRWRCVRRSYCCDFRPSGNRDGPETSRAPRTVVIDPLHDSVRSIISWCVRIFEAIPRLLRRARPSAWDASR